MVPLKESLPPIYFCLCVYVGKAILSSQLANANQGIAEDIHSNTKYECKFSNKQILSVSSELQCLHKCAFKKCDFLNYRHHPEGTGNHENCETFSDSKNDNSCSKLVNMNGWKSIVYRILEVEKNQKNNDTVFEKNTCCNEGNIALFKPSSQSSTHIWDEIHFVSAFGNDGNYDGDWRACAITKENSSPWWQVDLKREAVVGKVTVKSGTTWKVKAIDPFYLSVGNDSSNGGKGNPLCVNEGRLNGEENLFKCQSPLRGRFVSIFLERVEYLQVCEVSVYEAPFIIKHNSGFCISLRTSNSRFQLSPNCDEKFTFTANNTLKHLDSGNCVKPMGLADGSGVTLTGNCCNANSNFNLTSGLSMMHTQTGMCIHPPGSILLDYGDIYVATGCDGPNLQFNFIHVIE